MFKILSNLKTVIPLVAVSFGFTFYIVYIMVEKGYIKSDYKLAWGLIVFVVLIVLLGFLLVAVTSARSNYINNDGKRNRFTQKGKSKNSINNKGDENLFNQG